MIKISPKIWATLAILSLILNIVLLAVSGTLVHYVNERWDREIECEYICGDLGANGCYVSKFMERCECTVDWHPFHTEYFEDGGWP